MGQQGNTWVVEGGDNLFSIASQVYGGNQRMFAEIMRLNRLGSGVIRPGMKLILPKEKPSSQIFISNEAMQGLGAEEAKNAQANKTTPTGLAKQFTAGTIPGMTGAPGVPQQTSAGFAAASQAEIDKRRAAEQAPVVTPYGSMTQAQAQAMGFYTPPASKQYTKQKQASKQAQAFAATDASGMSAGQAYGARNTTPTVDNTATIRAQTPAERNNPYLKMNGLANETPAERNNSYLKMNGLANETPSAYAAQQEQYRYKKEWGRVAPKTAERLYSEQMQAQVYTNGTLQQPTNDPAVNNIINNTPAPMTAPKPAPIVIADPNSYIALKGAQMTQQQTNVYSVVDNALNIYNQNGGQAGTPYVFTQADYDAFNSAFNLQDPTLKAALDAMMVDPNNKAANVVVTTPEQVYVSIYDAIMNTGGYGMPSPMTVISRSRSGSTGSSGGGNSDAGNIGGGGGVTMGGY